MNILLGISGSVAATLHDKLVSSFMAQGHRVRVVSTDSAKNFLKPMTAPIDDKAEWNAYHTKKEILHIELVKWADVLCIAPASANTIGKMANGIVDNLLTSCYCAMPFEKRHRIVIAPACNTQMLNSPAVQRNIKQLIADGCKIVDPQYKCLACGDTGYGALANIFDIVAACDDTKFSFNFVPEGNHPGAFAFQRKNHVHTGVDLYVHNNAQNVYPFEEGIIIDAGQFTGPEIGMPWWNKTWYISIQTGNFVTVYGEILPNPELMNIESPKTDIKLGQKVNTMTILGTVIPVVNIRHPKYQNHNTKMLHVERFEVDKYDIGFHQPWEGVQPFEDFSSYMQKKPSGLLDPTAFLKKFKTT